MPTSSVYVASTLASSSVVGATQNRATASVQVANKSSDFGIQLPDACNFVKVNGGATVALCKAAPEPYWDKLLVTGPSIVLSLVAIGLSWWTFKYNRNKDQRSRTQSIQDDFWLRKIITPISIEPLLKYNMELATSLPVATSMTKEDVEKYWADQMEKIGELALSFRTLSLVSQELEKSVSEKMEEFEDCFVTYCGSLMSNLVSGTSANLPDKSSTTQQLTTIMISIFRLIQKHQVLVS